MALKYRGGDARQGKRVFGWGPDTAQLGLHEHRTGVICLGAQVAFCGSRLWGGQYPQLANPCRRWRKSMGNIGSC
ncbi:MAG: hypothetical protein ACFCVA_09390 [Gammaproteobacteria bacterium]